MTDRRSNIVENELMRTGAGEHSAKRCCGSNSMGGGGAARGAGQEREAAAIRRVVKQSEGASGLIIPSSSRSAN